jgi:outer membrane protein, multidrug efflux system
MKWGPHLFLITILFLSGCKLGPDYKRPTVPVPTGWKEPVPLDTSLANLQWWDVFQDPQLQELIRISLEENKDLKIAYERIEEARAFYGFQKADLYPRVDANASAAQQEISRDSVPKIPETIDTIQPIYTLNASVFWELDFFGRIRRATEAEQAIMLSTEQGMRFTVISLVSAVAQAYMELRDLDLRLQISRNTLKSRAEYVDLAKLRFEGGLTSELDFRQAESEYNRTLAIVQDLERQVSNKENEISFLLGRNPGSILRGRGLEEQPLPPQIPSGLPSTLLERRPDILEAEQLLVSANARIGEAKALLWPHITLTGFFGWETTEFSNLLSAPAKTWSIGANLLQPIFNAGKNRRNVEVQESRNRQQLYAYESTILQAFREVEDSLIDYQKFGEQRVSQAARVEADRRVLELAEVRYRGGVSDYLEVLDAQRSLFDAQLDAVIAVRDQLVALIRLYKALGGGWTEPAPPMQPAAEPQSQPAAASGG